jgi:tetratricopeptide (TPR) repeat protein
MKNFVAILLTLSLMQVCARSVYSQEGRPGFTSLSLSAEPEKAWATLGEPLTLKVRLTNHTQWGIAAQPALDPSYGTIQVYVSRNGGEFKRYLGPGWGTKDQPTGAAQIAPGESIYCDITLLFNNEVRGRDDLLNALVAIDEAGAYQIRVELYDTNFRRKITSPVIDLLVMFPMGEAEQAVWLAVESDKDLAYFMQTADGRRAKNVVEKAEQLVRRYPDNNQERQLALALGKYYLERDNVEQAIVYLKDAAASEPASLLRAQALLELAKSYTKKGDMDEAFKISEAASSEYAGKDIQQEFDQLILKIRKARESIQLGENPIPQ